MVVDSNNLKSQIMIFSSPRAAVFVRNKLEADQSKSAYQSFYWTSLDVEIDASDLGINPTRCGCLHPPNIFCVLLPRDPPPPSDVEKRHQLAMDTPPSFPGRITI